jgi:hypothetical protein
VRVVCFADDLSYGVVTVCCCTEEHNAFVALRAFEEFAQLFGTLAHTNNENASCHRIESSTMPKFHLELLDVLFLGTRDEHLAPCRLKPWLEEFGFGELGLQIAQDTRGGRPLRLVDTKDPFKHLPASGGTFCWRCGHNASDRGRN